MAKGQEVQNEGPGIVGYSPEDLANVQWTTEHVEAGDQVTFDTVGDTLIGIYAGHKLIYPNINDPDPEKASKWFIQLQWTVPGGSVFTNAGYELRDAYVKVSRNEDGTLTTTDKIEPGRITRNVLMKMVDVDQASEMKSFRVDSAELNGSNADNTKG